MVLSERNALISAPVEIDRCRKAFHAKFDRSGPGSFFFGTNRLGFSPIQSQGIFRCFSGVLHPPRRSLELCILVDRQYPMKNIAVDHSIALQVDAVGIDSSLEAAVDSHALRNDVAVELCTIADQNICGA